MDKFEEIKYFKRKIVVVEGLNGSGKSNLCKILSEYGGKAKHDDESNETDFKKGYIARISAPREYDLIMDRSPITEYVYGNVLRGISKIGKDDILEIFTIAESLADFKILYLEAKKEILLKRLENVDQKSKMLEKNYDKLKLYYDEIIMF